MEEEKQPPLPIKTKIAAWWMIAFGGIGTIVSVRIILPYLSVFLKNHGGLKVDGR